MRACREVGRVSPYRQMLDETLKILQTYSNISKKTKSGPDKSGPLSFFLTLNSQGQFEIT
jgi:hypothetical protein